MKTNTIKPDDITAALNVEIEIANGKTNDGKIKELIFNPWDRMFTLRVGGKSHDAFDLPFPIHEIVKSYNLI